MVKVEFLVLGLLKFSTEEAVLSENQINEVSNHISQQIIGKLETHDPYKVWSLSEKWYSSDENLRTLLKDANVKLGYYHHRIILRVTVDIKGEPQVFKSIREIRDRLHLKARELFNESLPRRINKDKKDSQKYPAVEILYVYTYPLIIIHGGKNILEKQIKDELFSIPTSTFFLELPELGGPRLIHTNYVRISLPSVIVYCEKDISRSILWDLINSVYYSCLYEKKQQDIKKYRHGFKRVDIALNKLNEGILRKLNHDLLTNVVEPERRKIQVRIQNTGLGIAVASVVIAIIAILTKLL
jgi:hypothetical protein